MQKDNTKKDYKEGQRDAVIFFNDLIYYSYAGKSKLVSKYQLHLLKVLDSYVKIQDLKLKK